MVTETMAELNIPHEPKAQQLQILYCTLVEKKDVLGVLPTGFGKSTCFGIASHLLNKVRNCTHFESNAHFFYYFYKWHLHALTINCTCTYCK